MEAVRAAARVCRSVQDKITPDVLQKDDRSPVTVADFASQAVICRAIGAAFPRDPIMGEEESATLCRGENAPFLDRILAELRGVGIDTCGKEACAWIDRASQKNYVPRFWTLDPIDGTKGFLRKEQYAISLALVVDGQIKCPSWVARTWRARRVARGPARCSTPSAAMEAGRCRWRATALRTGACEPGIRPEAGPFLRVGRSKPHGAGAISQGGRFARNDAGAAATRQPGEVCHRRPRRGGDLPAAACEVRLQGKDLGPRGGRVVVEEAGGRVSDVMGKPLEFNHGYELLANRGIVAANRQLHPHVIAALQEIYAKFPPPQEPRTK